MTAQEKKMEDRVSPSFRLMQLAADLGVAPTEFCVACNEQANGGHSLEELFQKAFGDYWYLDVLRKAQPEIEVSVLEDLPTWVREKYKANAMAKWEKRKLVRRYLRWVGSFFWDPAMRGLKPQI